MSEERTLRSALTIRRSWQEDPSSCERRARTKKTRVSRNRSRASIAVRSFFSHHGWFLSIDLHGLCIWRSSPGWPTILMGQFSILGQGGLRPFINPLSRPGLHPALTHGNKQPAFFFGDLQKFKRNKERSKSALRGADPRHLSQTKK